jgi:hypothetical protein
MPTEIVRHLSPEEQELARKRQELTILQAELTDRELSLANLRAELAAFEGRYLREPYSNAGGRAARGEVPSAPASVKALRPLRGAQNRAALTDASAPGEALS